MLALRRLFEGRKPIRRSSGKPSPRFDVRLSFESLEGRELLSASAGVLPQTDVLGQVKTYKLHITEPGYDYYRYGSLTDVATTPTPGLALEGGGTSIDQVYEWMGAKADGGDFLVLGTTGKDAYDSYIYKLNQQSGTPLNSVSTLIITQMDASWNSFVVDTINKAEAIFIKGGDQSTYINLWKDTDVQDAIQTAVDERNIPIGGTSAGLAVLGEYIYTAQNVSTTSSTALTNPYDPSITLDTGFLSLAMMENTITDSHFYQRDRMGRLDTFMARLITDFGAPAVGTKGIGIDEQTALLIDTSTGFAQVVGNPTKNDPYAGHIYFLQTTGLPQTCEPNQPLTYTDTKRADGILVTRASIGDTFYLDDLWAGETSLMSYTLLVNNGVVSSTQTNGSIY